MDAQQGTQSTTQPPTAETLLQRLMCELSIDVIESLPYGLVSQLQAWIYANSTDKATLHKAPTTPTA